LDLTSNAETPEMPPFPKNFSLGSSSWKLTPWKFSLVENFLQENFPGKVSPTEDCPLHFPKTWHRIFIFEMAILFKIT